MTSLRRVLRVLYWLAVLAVSLALLIALVLFLESRDSSSLSGAGSPPSQMSANS